jgi:H(+)-transporting ATP synthase subunit D
VSHMAATRLSLVRATRRLARLQRGAGILRRKREALVTELFRLARPAADARTQIAATAADAYRSLLGTLARHGWSGTRVLGWPGRDLNVTLSPGSVWGITVTHIAGRPPVARSIAARGVSPASTGITAVRGMERFERLAELLLDAAPREMLLRRLGEALARTSRQVHTLERRLSPQLQRDIGRVRLALEEREREERVRLQRLLRKRGIIAAS